MLPVSRAIGWAVLGVFVGAGEGVRAASLKKIAVGVLGGLVGGLVGGFALEYAALLFPQLAYPRLLGFLILGLAIGVFYGLVERGLSFGVLRLLTGPLKGKEFLLNQRRMNIGQRPLQPDRPARLPDGGPPGPDPHPARRGEPGQPGARRGGAGERAARSRSPG